jgi:hypothetical protein
MIVRTAALAAILLCLSACASNSKQAANPPTTQPVSAAHPDNVGIPTDIGTGAQKSGGGAY